MGWLTEDRSCHEFPRRRSVSEDFCKRSQLELLEERKDATLQAKFAISTWILGNVV
jgi:hypothetical protein